MPGSTLPAPKSISASLRWALRSAASSAVFLAVVFLHSLSSQILQAAVHVASPFIWHHAVQAGS